MLAHCMEHASTQCPHPAAFTLVLRWGPLWSTSTFITEGFNGVLGNLIHATKHKGQELINNIKITLGVEVLRHCVKGDPKHRSQLRQYEVLNKPLHNSQLSGEVQAAIEQHGIVNFTVHIRAKCNSVTYTSKLYDKKL